MRATAAGWSSFTLCAVGPAAWPSNESAPKMHRAFRSPDHPINGSARSRYPTPRASTSIPKGLAESSQIIPDWRRVGGLSDHPDHPINGSPDLVTPPPGPQLAFQRAWPQSSQIIPDWRRVGGLSDHPDHPINGSPDSCPTRPFYFLLQTQALPLFDPRVSQA